MIAVARGDVVLLVLCEQIQVVDKSRITRVIGHLDDGYNRQTKFRKFIKTLKEYKHE